MRVTDQQVATRMTTQLAQGWSRLVRIQQQVASGERIAKPSDSPVDAARAGALEETLRRLDEHGRTAVRARGLLETAEAALGETSNVLIRVRELAVQAASEQFGAERRQDMAGEVRAAFDQLVGLGNAEVAGRYLFAGFLSDRPAFQPDGTFQGDANQLELEVAPGLTIEATLRGDEIFSGSGGGRDLFGLLDDLATGLENDDTAAIQTCLDGLDAGLDQISAARGRAGARLSALDAAAAWRDRLAVGAETEAGRITDTDMSRATMELALAKNALEASMATAPDMLAMSILNRI